MSNQNLYRRQFGNRNTSVLEKKKYKQFGVLLKGARRFTRGMYMTDCISLCSMSSTLKKSIYGNVRAPSRLYKHNLTDTCRPKENFFALYFSTPRPLSRTAISSFLEM